MAANGLEVHDVAPQGDRISSLALAAVAMVALNYAGGVLYDGVVAQRLDSSLSIDDGPLAALLVPMYATVFVLPAAVILGTLANGLWRRRSHGVYRLISLAYVVLSASLHLWILYRVFADPLSFVTLFA